MRKHHTSVPEYNAMLSGPSWSRCGWNLSSIQVTDSDRPAVQTVLATGEVPYRPAKAEETQARVTGRVRRLKRDIVMIEMSSNQ